MGIFASKIKSDSDNFEKILSDLDIRIQKAEIRLSEIKIRQRRTSFKWIFYILVVWAICVVYLLQKLNSPLMVFQEYVFACTPIVLLPVGVYYTRKWMVHFYKVKQKQEESYLLVLHQEQKEKIEELKSKTLYYSTQSLIERYDGKELKKEPSQKKQINMNQPTGMNPVNGPLLKMAPIRPEVLQQTPQSKPQHQWYDKVIDVLVGDVGPETKYALICSQCYAHNGLVFKEEYDIIQYVCPVCKHHNPSRQSNRTQANVALKPQKNEESIFYAKEND